MAKFAHLLKKHLPAIGIAIVLTLLYVIENSNFGLLRTSKRVFQEFFESRFPLVERAYGYKMNTIIIGFFLLIVFRNKSIRKIFIPDLLFKELSFALFIGCVMAMPAIVGILTGFLEYTPLPLNFCLGMLSFFVITSFAEEIVFRAYPLAGVPANSPVRFTDIIKNTNLLVSSLFFGFWHVAQFGWWGWTGILSGYAFGFLYLSRRNIWPSFFAHVGMSMTTFVKGPSNLVFFITGGIGFIVCIVLVDWLNTKSGKKPAPCVEGNNSGDVMAVPIDKGP